MATLSMIFALWLASNLHAQQFPPWALSSLGEDNYDDHPALLAVGTPWKASIPQKTKQLRGLGTHIAYYNPAFGDLAYAVRANGVVNPGGSIATGLTYIFHVGAVPSPTGGLWGVLLTGVNAASRAEVRFLSWDGNSTPQSSQVSSLVTAGTTTERFLAAGIVNERLYVFDGASTEIREFVDTDSDGLPDAPSARAPVALSATPFEPAPVFGFFNAPANEVGVEFGGRFSIRNFEHYVVEPTATTLLVAKRENKREIHVVKPNVVGNQLVAGQEMIRIFGAFDAHIAVYELEPSGNEKKISGDYTVASPNGHVDVVVSPPLSAGQDIVIKTWSSTDSSETTSDLFGVAPNQLIVFDGEPTHVVASQQVFISGANFGHSTALTVKVNGTLMPVFSLRVNSYTYVFVAPTVNAGTKAFTLMATLTDGTQEATKKMWISD